MSDNKITTNRANLPNLLKATEDGCEFYTCTRTGKTGASITGLVTVP